MIEDIFLILVLAFLEGLLSIDNALVLAIMVRGLPKEQQRKALTYGLVGAVIFRIIALSLVTHLMKWHWIKWVGGGYLLWIALKHLLKKKEVEHSDAKPVVASFWKVVVMVELTDIAFAVDSILAAVAMSNRLWIVFVGGFIGVVMLRYASSIFIRLLDRFPNFESAAYWMILVVGTKLIVDGFHLPSIDFHSSNSPYFWGFWGLLLLCVLSGFRKKVPKGT